MFRRTPEEPKGKSANPSEDSDSAISAFRARREAAIEAYAARQQAEADAEAALPKTELAILAAEVVAKRLARRGPDKRRYVTRQPEQDFFTQSRGLITMGTFAVALALVVPHVTDASYGDERAASYLEQQGYTDVVSTATQLYWVALQGCGEGDEVKYEFTATAPNGETGVRPSVCKGLFKGATVRQG